MRLSEMSNQEYQRYVKEKSPRSPLGKNCLWSFCVGGLICAFGQLLNTFYTQMGLEEDAAGTAVSLTLIFLAALATGLNVFDKLAKHAGAGTLVPITGFANSVVSPAMEFKSEGMVTGMAAKMFIIAGPVIVFGVSASVIYGLILWGFGLA